VLRDLRLWIERDAHSSCAGLPVVPEVCGETGAVRTGVLATLADAAGGECAVRTASPDWVATSDLVLHVTRPIDRGTLLAVPQVLRRTRATIVIEVSIRAGDGAPAGLATTTFAVLPSRSEVQRMGAGRDEPRTEFALLGSRLDAPLPEKIGARVVDAAAGDVLLPLTPYLGNSLGALQGGMVATVADLASEAAGSAALGRPCGTRDLALNYLSMARVGPIRTQSQLLRSDASSALVRVEARDTGAEGRLVAVATSTVA